MNIPETNYTTYFELAFQEARSGTKHEHGGPFGAVLIKDGQIISQAHNTVLRDNDPTAHAEINAIREACKKLKTPHLEGCVMIASSEPCPMCLSTSYWAKIKEIRYASRREIAAKAGFADDFIYEDLEKSPEQRTIPSVWQPKLESEGKRLFKWWKKMDGRVY